MKAYSGGVRHDYKDTLIDPLVARRRHWTWFLLGLFLPLMAVAVLLIGEPDESTAPPPAAYVVEGPSAELPLALPDLREELSDRSTASQAATRTAGTSLKLVVKRGESLDILFRRNDLSLADLSMMVRLPEASKHLKMLRPGDEIQLTHQDGEILSFSRELDEISMLNISRGSAGFEANVVDRDVEKRAVSANGIIQSSLFESGQAAGISNLVTMNMAGIFQWDIDFIQDVRTGDEFTVIHEELWRDGVKLKDGEIIAAEFINQGDPYRAVRYIDGDGNSDYFTPEGRSVRKAFIRAPVDFTRISSGFNPNRRHPVLNTIRAHRGVDYAAPTGTVIKAAGDGKVTFRGVRNGYGNAVILQHGGNITTLYGHMSRFAAPRVGSRVKQGQTIGYVGQSGLATGPHLHYEYRLGGVHRNPRTVPLPPADPVPAEYWEDFQSAAAPVWRQLNLYRRARLATAD